MLFVCLSHFALEYFRPFPDRPEGSWLLLISLVASPTFMLVSGMMAGLLATTKGARFAGTRSSLASRGIFLLTVGHLLIVLACVPRYGLADAVWRGFITDAIGAAIIIGPWLVVRFGRTARLMLALALYSAATLLAAVWLPESDLIAVLRYVLVGPFAGRVEHANFPVLQWLSVYVAGTVLGGLLGDVRQDERRRTSFDRSLALIGVAAVVLAVSLKMGYWVVRDAGLAGDANAFVYALSSPSQKFPPGPVYLMLFGGAGLVLTACMLMLDRRGAFVPVLEWLAVFGRASLFVFLLQFYVYYVGVYLLALPFSWLWPLYYGLTIWVLHLAGRWWLDRGYNRWFDVRLWFEKPRETGS